MSELTMEEHPEVGRRGTTGAVPTSGCTVILARSPNCCSGSLFKRWRIRPVPTADAPAGLPRQGRRPAASFRAPVSPR